MSLYEKIKSDKIFALKCAHHCKKDLLGVIAAQALSNAMSDQKNPSKEPSDALVISTIEKQIKSNQEVIEQIKGSNREDSVRSLVDEITILEEYVPKKMSEEELWNAIADFKNNAPVCNVGLIMKHLKDNFAGKYDGSMASKIAKEI